VALPDAAAARVSLLPGGPAGALREQSISSQVLGNERPVWTYVTAGAQQAAQRWLLVLTDGATWAAPERTIIAGSSLGALTAAYAVLRAPHRFGYAYSMAGSFWWPSPQTLGEEPAWLTRCFAAAPRLPARFRLEVGLQEHGLLGFTRHMRDVLLAKGYPVSYSEYNGGHDRLCWVAGFAAGLEQLTRGDEGR